MANKEKNLIAMKKFSLEANKLTNKLACKIKDSGTKKSGVFPYYICRIVKVRQSRIPGQSDLRSNKNSIQRNKKIMFPFV
jgi:hypothetical protein